MTRRQFNQKLLAGAAAARTLAADTTKDRGKRLIDKTVEALGGEAFRTMRTRTEIGRAYSFYREKINGLAVARIYTKYLEPDGKGGVFEVQRQVLGKKQEDVVLFAPDEAYDITYRGAKPLPEQQVKQFRDTTLHNVFYVLRERLGEPGLEFEGAGMDVVENQPVETIDIFDSQNRSLRVWVNSDTFLPVKQRFYSWDPIINDRREEVSRYTKYRKVGNIMWPYEVERERDTEKIYQLFSETVTVNDPLPDSMFELPNGIKMLKR